MKYLLEILKTTLLGGLGVLLPLVLFSMLLGELLDVVVLLATPIADIFPAGTFDDEKTPLITGAVLLCIVSFAIGLLIKCQLLRRIGGWLEKTLMHKVPFYVATRSLARGLLGQDDDSGRFQPALFRAAEDEWQLVYAIEKLRNNMVTILIPSIPCGFTGYLRIVPQGRVRLLETNLGKASAVIAEWGVGMDALIAAGDGEEIAEV